MEVGVDVWIPDAAEAWRRATVLAKRGDDAGADGGPAKAKVETFTVGTMPVTLVEIEGEYMGMGGAWHQADQRMLVSMVQAPVGSVFLKLLGPEGTVDANRQAYMDFVKGLKPTQ